MQTDLNDDNNSNDMNDNEINDELSDNTIIYNHTNNQHRAAVVDRYSINNRISTKMQFYNISQYTETTDLQKSQNNKHQTTLQKVTIDSNIMMDPTVDINHISSHLTTISPPETPNLHEMGTQQNNNIYQTLTNMLNEVQI